MRPVKSLPQQLPLPRVYSPKPGRRLLGWSALIALGVGFAYGQLSSYLNPPKAMLVLGGALEREQFAAEFARQHSDLPIWVSSGSNSEYAEWLFAEAGIERDRLHLDYAAVDTLTNFTTLVDKLQAQGIQSVYLITSDYHMRRARLIGVIVLGSRGMHFRPMPVPSTQSSEGLEKALFDGARALLWVTTGSTGSVVGQALRTHQHSVTSAPTVLKEWLTHLLPELKHKAGQSEQ